MKSGISSVLGNLFADKYARGIHGDSETISVKVLRKLFASDILNKNTTVGYQYCAIFILFQVTGMLCKEFSNLLMLHVQMKGVGDRCQIIIDRLMGRRRGLQKRSDKISQLGAETY